jgi:predicted transcriptional regulator YheO
MALSLYHDKTHSIDDICEELHISRSTLFRYVRQAKQSE